MTVFLIVCWTLTGLAVAATIIFSSATTWYITQSGLWWSNPDEARRREQHKPWYVRFHQRVNRKRGTQ